MLKTILKNTVFATVVLAVCGPAAYAKDTLILKNGDRISGHITQGPEGMIAFQTHYGAELAIPVSQIMAVQNGAGEIYSADMTPSPKTEEITEAVTEEVAKTEPAAGFDENNPSKYKWSGRVNLGASLDDGNNQKKALTGDAEVKARNEKNRWIAGLDANFANDEGTETENDQSLFGEYNRFLSEKWFVGLRQEFERDKIALLDLRSSTGPFAGYQFFEEEDLNLRVKFGADYIYEDFETGDTEENIAASWGLDYDQTFWEALTLFHDHTFDLPVDETEAFIFQSKTGVRVPVAKNLVGTAQVDFDWDNAPATGIREEDTSYSLKLGYEW